MIPTLVGSSIVEGAERVLNRTLAGIGVAALGAALLAGVGFILLRILFVCYGGC